MEVTAAKKGVKMVEKNDENLAAHSDEMKAGHWAEQRADCLISWSADRWDK